MPFLQFMRVRTVLEVLLERVLADVGGGGSNGCNGRLVNEGGPVLSFGGHDLIWFDLI